MHIADDKSQVLPEEEDRELERKLQMEKRTFFTICGMLESEIQKQDTGWRSAVPVDVRLGVTLYKLFKNTDYLDLADKFGIGESTAHEIVMDTTAAIVKCLRYKIHFPSTAKEEPDCLMLLGRLTTRLDGESYYDWKQRYSVIFKKLLTLPAVLAYDDRIKPYLVGDKGYQLQQHLMIPHTTPNLRPSKAAFNLHHHLARIMLGSKTKDPAKVPSQHHQELFLIDVGETDLWVEIQAWRKEVKRLKDQDLFVDYGDPEQAEGEPCEELHSPEDAKECSNALFLSANLRVFYHLNLRHVQMQKSL
ncbi:hypothetical protein SELMODRAFT_412228 [Selaginella moellendorffii]|uniref:DDE Tnp4 domain-containing protein n=1 Tax=Selaginella moellendorffii TaxID=88036 RepID=D8RKH6_SELML|nr:hypothetical protein SELMODRAFT_412228 [Selaginella moellendorffii]